MTCVSSVNSHSLFGAGRRFALCAAFLLLALFAAPDGAVGRTPASPPATGLEGGHRRSFGPDGEGRRDPRVMTAVPMDAYGNPVIPKEPEEERRGRPRPGAYGPRPAQTSPPLPDAPETDAGWKFK